MTSVGSRRSDFAFLVAARRVADINLHEGRNRLGIAAALALTVALSGAVWWAWIVVALAAVGAYQGVVLSWYALDDSRGEPSEPVARWAYRSAVAAHGKNAVNVSGVIEGLAAIGFGVLAAWAVPSGPWQLALLALGGAWILSLAVGIFIDPAFYRKGAAAGGLEFLRRWCGVLVAALVVFFAIAGEAFTDTISTVTIFVIAFGSGSLLKSRIGATDIDVRYAEQQAMYEAAWGRQLVLKEIHTNLSPALTFTLHSMEAIRRDQPDIYRQVRDLRAVLDQVGIMQDPRYDTSELPEALVWPLRRCVAVTGARAEADIRVDWLPSGDLKIAREAMLDLANNATAAGADTVRVGLAIAPPGLIRLTVDDDAGGIPVGKWCRPGSSLERLRFIHRGLGGDLTVTVRDGHSVVTATWEHQEGEPDGSRLAR